MEPTSAANAAVEGGSDLGTPRLDRGLSLFTIVDHWAHSGASVPVAIVGSIFDDVLSDPALRDLRASGGALRLDDLWLDEHGVAHLEDRSRASVDALAVLLVRVLGEDPPPSALAVIARFEDVGARDVEELRAWTREACGAIATHDELAAIIASFSMPPEASQDLPATQSTPLGIAQSAIDFAAVEERPSRDSGLERDNATEIIRTRSLPAFPSSFAPAPQPIAEEEPEIPILSAIPEPLPETQLPSVVFTAPAAEAPPVPADTRPVIRHQLPKPNVSVQSAPAARRSGKRVADPRDSLMIPDDRPHWGAWIFVILLLGIGALFWLRYL